MLIERTLFGEIDRVKVAIQFLRDLEPPEGYYLAFSGGKDSVVIKRLAEMAGVKFTAHYNLTTIDPPELVQFIRRVHPDVVWDRPKMSFLKRMVEKGCPPLRNRRWCCEEYKETGGVGMLTITGVRKAESNKRSKRKTIDYCARNNKRMLNVIVEWSEDDVWTFIRNEKLPYCSLYDEGFKRLGCLFCPSATLENRLMEIERYPKNAEAFKRAFAKMWDKTASAQKCFPDGAESWWQWWLSDNSREDHDQGVLFE